MDLNLKRILYYLTQELPSSSCLGESGDSFSYISSSSRHHSTTLNDKEQVCVFMDLMSICVSYLEIPSEKIYLKSPHKSDSEKTQMSDSTTDLTQCLRYVNPIRLTVLYLIHLYIINMIKTVLKTCCIKQYTSICTSVVYTCLYFLAI